MTRDVAGVHGILRPLCSPGFHLAKSSVHYQQVDIIADLQELGYDAKQATQVVERLLQGLRTRPNDNAVIKTIQKMLSS